MRIEVLTELINHQLADEIVSTAMLQIFMDSVIDDINAKLNAKFPTITEWLATTVDTSDYTAIPDRYLRSVVVPGTAFKYYVMDEEGTYAAPKYEQQYREALLLCFETTLCRSPKNTAQKTLKVMYKLQVATLASYSLVI